MPTIRFLLASALLLTLTGCAATGSSKFACPRPQGVTCMGALDVYKATNNANEVRGIDADEAAKLAREGKSAGKTVGSAPAPAAVTDTPVAVRAAVTSPAAPSGQAPAIAPSRCCSGRKAAVTVDGNTLAIAPPGTASVTNYRDYQATQAMAARPALAKAAGVPAMGSDNNPDAFRQPAKIMRIYVRPWEDESGDLHMSGFIFTEIEPRRWTVADRVAQDDGLFRLLDTPGKEAAQEASAGVGTATPTAHRPGAHDEVAPTQKE
jgi:conjugal transfer pilus assembly protein TraV